MDTKKDLFISWLSKQLSPLLASNYIQILNRLDTYVKEKRIISGSIFDIKDPFISKMILTSIKFDKKNQTGIIKDYPEIEELAIFFHRYVSEKQYLNDTRESPTSKIGQRDAEHTKVHDLDLEGQDVYSSEIPIKLSQEIRPQSEKEDLLSKKDFGVPVNPDVIKIEKPYYEIIGVNPSDYSGCKIESLGFSNRLLGRLINNGYTTLEKLLLVNDAKLGSIRGFGAGCFHELSGFLSSLSESGIGHEKNKKNNSFITEELIPFKENLLNGDFNFVNDFSFTPISMGIINRCREAHTNLDIGLIKQLMKRGDEAFELRDMLQDYINRIEDQKAIEQIILQIPENRLKTKIPLVLKCFTNNESIRQELQKLSTEDQQSLYDYLCVNAGRIRHHDQNFIKLAKWCQYDLEKDIESFFVDQKKNDREIQVINARASLKTLEEIGKRLDITRERVRQIEKKLHIRFNFWQSHKRILYKIFLQLGEEVALSSMEIINCVGAYGKAFVYLMKDCVNEDFFYDKQLDMFAFANLSLSEKIQSYVESLPNTFHKNALHEFLRIAEEDNNYPAKMVMALIGENYKKTGDTYHRFRLNLTTIYSDVMKKYYPNGIHIYDQGEIEIFRRHIKNDYGIDITDKSDHSIGAILSRIGILCGRGIYKYRQKSGYISKALSKRIYDYIENSPSPIFMTNTLFSVFEKELLAEGIDNKYFLQGILRDIYDDKWFFRRDYISKDESYTTVYSNIVGYIRNSQHPLSREELYKEFPGVTEIVINMSVSDPNILNLFGQYIHSCRLRISNTDLKYLRNTLDRLLSSMGVCHCREIYNYISNDYPSLLTNNYVYYPFSMYSLLDYLFGEHYNFSRPYVAKKNATIERVTDVLIDIIRESDHIEISEIQSFAKEHGTRVNNIREFIDSCNDTHLMINDIEVASIEYIGITEQIAKEIENSIVNEIDETVPIFQLQSIHSLPKINVVWTDWLIYSVLKKWSTKLEVGASASQLRQSYPLVAPLGKLKMINDDDLIGNQGGTIIMADDLSNIDELIGDIILEDLEGFNGL